MEIITSIQHEITIVKFSGNLDTSTSSSAKNEVNSLLENNVSNIIFDLSETSYVSSSGLRVFLETAKKTTGKGGKLILCAPNDVVSEILAISGFNTIIPVQDTVEDALSEF